MISLRFFFLILLTLCCRELAGELPTLDFEKAFVSVVGITLGFAILTKMAAYRTLRQETPENFASVYVARDKFHRRRLQIERLWCAALPLMLLATGWYSWMNHHEQNGWPQALVLLTCFLPSIALLMLVEVTAAQFDQLCSMPRYGVQSLQCSELEQVDALSSSWTKQWKLRIRLGDMAGLGTCLFPVFLLAGISDCGSWASDLLGVESWWIKAPLAASLVLAFVAMFPVLLTRWSGGQPMPDKLQARINAMMMRIGLTGVQSVLIPSQHRWAGAAIVGWFPKCRRLWLGDAIVEGLSPRQLDMVVLHELAHVTRTHFIWRAFPVLCAMFFAASIWALGINLQLAESMAFKFFVGLMAAAVLLVGLGVMARRCELDADRVACDLAMQATDWSHEQSPAKTLGSALSLLLDESPSKAATWLHPSLFQRLESLKCWLPKENAIVHSKQA